MLTSQNSQTSSGRYVLGAIVLRVLVALCFCLGPAVSAQVMFEDMTAASGLSFTLDGPVGATMDVAQNVSFGAGAAVADYDLDGDLDVYFVASLGRPNQLYRNNGDKTFTNVTSAAGVGDTGFGHMALFTDLDNDGDADLIVGNDTQGDPAMTPSKIFRNNGDGTFTDVTTGSGFNPQGNVLGGMSVSDIDGDGDLDIYVGMWTILTIDGSYQSYLYENMGGFRFRDITATAGLRTPTTAVAHWSVVFCDLNNDGHQDLYAAIDFSPNYFFINDGTGKFIDVSIGTGVRHVGNDMGVTIADADGDGLFDVYSTNYTVQPPDELAKTNVLYMYNGASFTDEAISRGVWQSYWGWGTKWLDVDLDGDEDLFCVNGWDVEYYRNRPTQLFVNDGTGFFTERAAAYGADHRGDSRSLVAFDYDNDGDEDLLIVDVAAPVTLLENTTNHANNWVAIEVHGRPSNRDGIGTRIELTAGGKTQMREFTMGESFYASLPLRKHVGLGPADVIDELVVRFPSGCVRTFESLAANRLLTITENMHHDSDLDGDVDIRDFGDFQNCFTKLGGRATPRCRLHDADNDGDIDLADYANLQLTFTGPR